jgi:hypothetical protein
LAQALVRSRLWDDDGAVGAAAAELEQLALDTAVAPVWVLVRQADDQLLAFGALAGRPRRARRP